MGALCPFLLDVTASLVESKVRFHIFSVMTNFEMYPLTKRMQVRSIFRVLGESLLLVSALQCPS